VNTILWANSPHEVFSYVQSWNGSSSITISYSDVEGGQDSIVTNNNVRFLTEQKRFKKSRGTEENTIKILITHSQFEDYRRFSLFMFIIID
jgi:hypothetical protein